MLGQWRSHPRACLFCGSQVAPQRSGAGPLSREQLRRPSVYLMLGWGLTCGVAKEGRGVSGGFQPHSSMGVGRGAVSGPWEGSGEPGPGLYSLAGRFGGTEADWLVAVPAPAPPFPGGKPTFCAPCPACCLGAGPASSSSPLCSAVPLRGLLCWPCSPAPCPSCFLG